jgi:hypothetical protein
MKRHILIVLILPLIMAGCESAYFKTETMPRFSYTNSQGIIIFMTKNPTIEDQKFFIILQAKMKEHGFNIVEKFPADYGLFFKLYGSSSTSSVPLTMPTTSYSSGYVGNTYYSGSTTSSNTTYIPVTTNFKKIMLTLYDAKKNTRGEYDILWSGYMGAEENYYYGHSDAIIEKLISFLGTDFKGEIEFDQWQPVQ